MTWQAIIFLAGSWGVILGCTGHCFWKLLTSERTLGDD